MPRIQTYEQRTNAPAPSPLSEQSGAAFGAQVSASRAELGQAASQFGNQIVQTGEFLVQKAEKEDEQQADLALAKAQADHLVALEERAKKVDLSNPEAVDNFSKQFLEDYETTTSPLRDELSTSAGKARFDYVNARQMAEFQRVAHSAQAELKGVKARKDVETVRTQRLTAVSANPSSYLMNKELQESELDRLRGVIPAADLAKYKLDSQKLLVEAALRGRIERSPSQAIEEIGSGKWDNELNVHGSDLKHQLLREAKEVKNSRRVDAEIARAAKERAKKEAQTATENKLVQRMFAPQTGEPEVTAKEISDSNISPDDKIKWIDRLDRRAKGEEVRKNPALFNSLLKRISSPPGTPGRITDEAEIMAHVWEGRLPFEDAGKLRSEVQGRRTSAGQREKEMVDSFIDIFAKKLITQSNPGLGQMDFEGDTRLYKFKFFVDDKIEEQRKANKPIRNLFDKDHPEFLGKTHIIKPYMITGDEVISKFVESLNPPTINEGALKKLPNESINDFRKRRDAAKGKL